MGCPESSRIRLFFCLETPMVTWGYTQFIRLLKVEQLMFAYDGWGGSGLFAVGGNGTSWAILTTDFGEQKNTHKILGF